MHLAMFDIDGTLVDSDGFDGKLFARAIREEIGVEIDETWETYRHVTDSGVLEEVLRASVDERDQPARRERVRRKFVAFVEDYIATIGLEPILGAPELLRELQAMSHVVVAIATGGWKETAEMKMRAVGIDLAGLPFATSSDAEARIDIMRLAEQRASSQGEFSRRIYFGDAPWDSVASAALGYDFVAVGDRLNHAVRFENLVDQQSILEVLSADC